MYRSVISLILLLICGTATAHQWTPTYVEFEPSHVAGIYKTKMKLFNSRDDAEYYQIQVLDGQFGPIKFAITGGRNDIVHAPTKSTKYVEVYVPSYEVSRVVYVCSRSMILQKNETTSVVSSRICSKVQ